MLAVVIGALIAAIGLSAALLALLAWQMKRAAAATDTLLAKSTEHSKLRIAAAANKVALADKERALNLVLAERDRLEFTLDTITDQRNALLEESLEHATPGSIAISIRDALKRLRMEDTEEAEALPDLPGS